VCYRFFEFCSLLQKSTAVVGGGSATWMTSGCELQAACREMMTDDNGLLRKKFSGIVDRRF
jgi:hypothetical protein